MTTYYVSPTGADSADRDGLSAQTAWQSLAYASDRTPAGDHTIQLSAGTFVATETARPKSGITIVGAGHEGETQTKIVASADWPLSADPTSATRIDSEYLIALKAVQDVTIRDLTLTSEPSHHITGAVHAERANGLTVHHVTVQDFRWAGLDLSLSERLLVHNNHIENASTEKHGFPNGLIRTRFLKHSEFHHNTVVSTTGGYGYKGGGHENVRIHHNTFDLASGFAIESAHKNEFGVEIDHNWANATISIPKGRQSADPSDRGYDYTFWIHHNFLTDSYTIEGPRNHLRVSHNYVRIADTGGRVYTHHGGVNYGPVWIHHNVVENVDRNLIWMNQGLAENIFVFNNTVTFANAGDRAGAILSAPNRETPDQGANRWIAKNNIFLAPKSQPRNLLPNNSAARNVDVTHNIVQNLKNVPENNFDDISGGLLQSGNQPWPFYAPASEASPLVDSGTDVGLSFLGEAPDIGAYELGEEAVFPVSFTTAKKELFQNHSSVLVSMLLLSMVSIGWAKLKR
ncbi:MAG: right-handed parallel beta-helix repeat-containing protein [Cyanobacteria bacterium J06560_2]